jgi:hypothetical protein
MLRSVKSLEGFAIGATDGAIGKVKDFYFDDEAWVVRYVVVDTSAWLGGRDVLISPYSVGEPSWSGDILPVKVTKEQIKNSPSINSDRPVSRQYERSYLGYYGYPYYWGGPGLWGDSYYPGTLLTGMDADVYPGYLGYLRAPSANESNANPHLRSSMPLRDITFTPKTARLVTCKGLSSTTIHGRFAILSLTPAIGGWDTRC